MQISKHGKYGAVGGQPRASSGQPASPPARRSATALAGKRVNRAMQSRWALIERFLIEFHALLAPEVARLTVEKGIDCSAAGRLEQGCPALKRKGVYLVFDEHETLIYIGSTIEQPLLKRVRSQISRFKQARWFDIIPFESKQSYFIPALEMYLIQNAKRAELNGERGIALLNKIGTFEPHSEWLVRMWAEELAPK